MKTSTHMIIATALVAIGCGKETSAPKSSTSAQAAENASLIHQSPQSELESETVSLRAQTPVETLDMVAPSNAKTMFVQAKAKMIAGQRQQGYATAQKALKEFTNDDVQLESLLLESIEVGERRVDVYFNMGPLERDMPEEGIVKPLSFHVSSSSGKAEDVRIIDFEVGRIGGESVTAAIGMTHDAGHANFGMYPVDAPYVQIVNGVTRLFEAE